MMVAARTGKSRPRKGIARTRSSWEAKLRPQLEPRVVRDPKLGGRLLIATPLLVAEEIARVPRGAVATVSELRARLAERFKADRTCPLTTGIFAAILAGAVSEDIARHRTPRWPIWRLLRDDGRLNTNWALDARYRAALLRDEGLRITRANDTWKVMSDAAAVP